MLNNDSIKNPFGVPEDYFEVLPMKVQERCMATSKNGASAGMSRHQLAFATGLGVIALGVASVFTLMDVNFKGNHNAASNGKVYFSNPYARMPMRSSDYSGSIVRDANVFSVGNRSNAGLTDPRERNEIMMNQLAIENLSIDDILSAGF